MQVYGIDLSKEKFDVSFIDAKGKEKNRSEAELDEVNLREIIIYLKTQPSLTDCPN